MRVLIVGSESKYAIERPYRKYLSQIPGMTAIELFPAQNIFLKYYRRSLVNKMIYRTGLSGILREINGKLIDRIISFRPEIVFVFKGMEVLPETLKWIKMQGIKLVNYNPDNPFLFSGKGSGNGNIRPSIPLYDLHFTYDELIKARIEEEYRLPVRLLPFGYDIDEQTYMAASSQSEILKACFVGNADKHRADFISKLAASGIQVDVYGIAWKKFLKSADIEVNDPVYDDNLWYTMRRYRVQLNLMRPHNPHSHNMRTFEVPAVGGIQLAPDTLNHRSYFEPDKEIFLFRDVSDCERQIVKLLSMTQADAQFSRDAARTRSLAAGYSYKERAGEVYKVFCGLIGG